MPSITSSQAPRYGSLEEMAHYQTEGYWEDRGGIRHAFDTSDGTAITVDLSALTGEGRQLARWALEAWEAVADVAFHERTGGADIAFHDDAAGARAGADWYADGDTIGAWVNVGTDWLAQYGTTIDSYGFSTYLHEIGHALGLGHQGDYDGNALYERDTTFTNDSWQLSAMSYFTQRDNTAVGADRAELLSAMQVDITAIQDLYGASTKTAGDTVWGVGATVDGHLGRASEVLATGEGPAGVYAGKAVAMTIYDHGGTDMLNLSTRTTDDRINLFQGGFSDVGGTVGNLAIAHGTIIERLAAGSGDNLVNGNAFDNEIFAGAGNDTIWSAAGDDSVYGGAGSDVLGGGGGFDHLYGGDGDDTIYGNGGDDRLGGGLGDDRVLGHDGDDGVYGAAGHDHLSGGAGNDTIWAGTGDDAAFGGAGDDLIGGGLGADSLVGGGGADTIYGWREDDTIRGEGGDDEIWAGTGDDVVEGGGGDDRLWGVGGDDVIDGGAGADRMSGGAGADTFVFARGAGRDTILDFAAEDRLRLDADLWEGTLEADQAVARFARIDGDDAVLDFGSGDEVTLLEVSGLSDLAGRIDIV